MSNQLWHKVEEQPDGCWHLANKPDYWGYQTIMVNYKRMKAHRYYYELHKGPVPEGLQLDHLCRNRQCVNPDHLEPVTAAENARRSPIALAGINGRKTHCDHGHPLEGENLIIRRNGNRACRECNRRHWREYSRRRYALVKQARETA